MSGLLLQGISRLLFLLAGWLHPRERGASLTDLMWNLMNGAALSLLRFTAVAWVADRSTLGLVPTDALSAGWQQALVAFVLLDLSRYWLHRAGHRVPWLWTFHRVHHSAEHLDATTGLRMHVVDFLLLSGLPIVLFGVLLDTSGFEGWVIPAVLGIGVVFDAWQHANLPVDPKHPLLRAWGLLLNHPHFHCWHHTRDGARCDGNYSNTLIIWDRLFGTEVTGPRPPEAYGLEADQALRNDPLGWQLLVPRAGSPRR